MVDDGRALLEGGPLDGHEVDVEDGADELVVTMLDRSVHRYERTTGSRPPAGGRSGAVLRWAGRQGPGTAGTSR